MRRRQKFTWFPPLGTESTGDSGTYWYAHTFTDELPAPTNVTVGPSLGVGVIYAPVVPDFTQEPGQDQGGTLVISLRDRVEGSDWLLKRIVGSVFVHFSIANDATGGDPSVAWNGLLATVGYMVAPSDDLSQESMAFQSSQQYEAQALVNAQNPWIWRRTWLLRNPNADGGNGNLPVSMPSSNIAYGDIRSGTHIDSKVARRIGREHRLWQVVSVSGYDTRRNSVSGDSAKISVVSDVRILGAMRRGKNTSSF